jgi:N-acetyl-anhydromuramoyl-L-alanine amidase
MARRQTWDGGWWTHARRRPCTHHDERPAGLDVSLAVVHSISLPPGVYHGPAVQHLFAGRLDTAAHPYYAALAGLRVSAHFFIRRSGRVLQFVPCERRAWHAGVSQWRGRDRCNDFSIGIELEGLPGDRFEAAQYRQLARLLRALRQRHPLADVTGHQHIAPGRKDDPGPGFDWVRLRRHLQGSGLQLFATAA